MAKTTHTPIEYRQINLDGDTFYASRHNLIGTGIQVYQAWANANGHTLEYTTVTYVEDQPAQAWLGRIGTKINHVIASMPIGDERTAYAQSDRAQQYHLATNIIREAFPETYPLDTTEHMGTLVYTPKEG